MTSREKFLTIGVGALLVLGVGQWCYNKYQTAVETRKNEIETLSLKQIQLADTVQQGLIAGKWMGKYEQMSLPSDIERARSDYQRWLLDVVTANGISGAKVDPISTPMPVKGVYTRLSYRVDGEADFVKTLKMLHAFYAKNYLHRVAKLDLTPNKTGTFAVKMTVDVIALDSAPPEATEPPSTAWQVAADASEQLNPILNRNLFEPPNQPPSYTGNKKVEAIVGRRTPIPLTYADPEKHPIAVELVGEFDERVSLSPGSSTLQVDSDEKGEIDVKIRLTDEGYPRRSTEQTLTVAIVDPPPPPPVPEPELEFDDATTTYLTGLIQGESEWVAWMNVRTRGTTLKLRVGDGFEVGSISGKVTEITGDYVEIEAGDRRFRFSADEALKEAAKAE